MLKSIREIAALAGVERSTVVKRIERLGIAATPGPKQAKLYPSEKLLRLVPVHDEGIEGVGSLEEARIRQTVADARVKELTAEKLEGNLAPVSEILEWQNAIFDEIAAQIKASDLEADRKETVLSEIQSRARKWREMQ